ncbi:MAG: hypothetical protein ACI828_002884 [Flavobacteriales bacterium]|jgi:hypothetical protein
MAPSTLILNRKEPFSEDAQVIFSHEAKNGIGA